MAPRFTIRPATERDAESILDCLRSAFQPYRDRYTREAFADTVLTTASIHERLATMSVLVATGEVGDVVATIAYRLVDAAEGHLRGMAVRPSWQGSGVADALIASVESELLHRGCSRVTLDTVEALERAIAFYQRRGFRRTGRVTDYFGMPLIEYAKPLTRKQA